MRTIVTGGMGTASEGGRSELLLDSSCQFCKRVREQPVDDWAPAICGLNNGEHQLFERCVKASRVKWLRRIRNGMGRLSHSDADDVFQETCLRVYRKAATFDCLRNGEPWFARVVFCEQVNFLRRRRRSRMRYLPLTFDPECHDSWLTNFEPPSREPNPVDECYERELALIELEAIDSLPIPLQQIYALWRNGLNDFEVAASLNLFVNQIKYRKRKVVAWLNKEIAQRLDDDLS